MSYLEDFYRRFTGSYIQTFDDQKKNRGGMVSCFPASELPGKKQWLIENNKKGMGVFFTPNPCEGGRKEENVKSISWVYADLDDASYDEMVEKVRSTPLPPNIVVSSGRGFHFYWNVELDKDQFEKIISGIIHYFGSDPAIASTNEVLRLPGFYHMKDPNSPHRVKILMCSEGGYMPEDLMDVYPAPERVFVRKHYLKEDDLTLVRDIPIKDVLAQLGVQVNRNNFIVENGEVTSASINVSGNYINRFSGKPGSGSVIDAAMVYGDMKLAEAIAYLEKNWNIKQEKRKIAVKKIVEEKREDGEIKKEKVYTWGTEGLDERITPIMPHHLVMLVGASGKGKTTFCFDVAKKNAQDHRVLFLSLEMNRNEIVSRVSRAYSGITKQQWRDRSKISQQQREAYKRQWKEIEEMKGLMLKGFPKNVSPTTENIFAVIEELNPDLVFIDNFDLITKKEGEYEEQNRVSSELMDFSNNFKIPIVVLHHLKKGKVEGMDAVRGSAKIVHNCDTLLECKREDYSEDNTKKDNARLLIKEIKSRDFGTNEFAIIYFYKGSFYDEFPEKKWEKPEYWQDN